MWRTLVGRRRVYASARCCQDAERAGASSAIGGGTHPASPAVTAIAASIGERRCIAPRYDRAREARNHRIESVRHLPLSAAVAGTVANRAAAAAAYYPRADVSPSRDCDGAGRMRRGRRSADPRAPDAEPGPRTGDPDGGPDGPPIRSLHAVAARRRARRRGRRRVVDEGCAWRLGPAHALTAIDGGARRDARCIRCGSPRRAAPHTVSTLLGVRALVSTREGTDRPFGPGLPIPATSSSPRSLASRCPATRARRTRRRVRARAAKRCIAVSEDRTEGRAGSARHHAAAAQDRLGCHLRGDGLELVHATTHGGLYGARCAPARATVSRRTAAADRIRARAPSRRPVRRARRPCCSRQPGRG